MVFKPIQFDELCCSICQEKFGNHKQCPRILNCGHTFCTGCLKAIMREQPMCPDCREQILENDIETFPVVYIVKQIIESIENFNELQEQLTPSEDCNKSENKSVISLTNNIDSFPSVGICLTHNAPQQFYCQSCSLWICGSCTYLIHNNKVSTARSDNPQEFCEIVTAVKHFETLLSARKKKLKDQMKELRNAVSTVNNFTNLLKEEIETIKSYPRISISETKLLETYNQILKNLIRKESDLEKSFELVDDLRGKLNVESLSQLHSASKYIDSIWVKFSYPKLEDSLIEGIFTNIINTVPQVLMKVNGIIASLRCGNKQLYSQIKFEDEFMVISSLKESAVEGNHIIPFQEIKKKSKHMKTFLRLSRQGIKLGTVEIKIFDNRRSEQFVMLCTGEKGPSYKWTKFFSSGGLFTQFLAGGDYEKNDGSGGAQIINDVGDPYGILMEDGIVCGEISFHKHQLAQFKIFYKVGSRPFAHCPIGIVVKGLPLIQEIAQQDFNKVYIEECGIMVPIKSD